MQKIRRCSELQKNSREPINRWQTGRIYWWSTCSTR